MGFFRGLSVCAGEGEEETSELVFARFLVVSELGGDGGHIPRTDDRRSLSPSLDTYIPERAPAYVIPPHLSPRQPTKDHGHQAFRQ